MMANIKCNQISDEVRYMWEMWETGEMGEMGNGIGIAALHGLVTCQHWRFRDLDAWLKTYRGFC
jgi:hypothetical protein